MNRMKQVGWGDANNEPLNLKQFAFSLLQNKVQLRLLNNVFKTFVEKNTFIILKTEELCAV